MDAGCYRNMLHEKNDRVKKKVEKEREISVRWTEVVSACRIHRKYCWFFEESLVEDMSTRDSKRTTVHSQHRGTAHVLEKNSFIANSVVSNPEKVLHGFVWVKS